MVSSRTERGGEAEEGSRGGEGGLPSGVTDGEDRRMEILARGQVIHAICSKIARMRERERRGGAGE